MQRRRPARGIDRSPQRLAIDGDHRLAGRRRAFAERGGKAGHEATESLLEDRGIEKAKNPAERIVARHAVLKPQKFFSTGSLALPNIAISEQLSAPHKVAAKAIGNTSDRSCQAFSARGSGTASNSMRRPCIAIS
jgi:hypothetical protein